jgi:hypothetical protein
MTQFIHGWRRFSRMGNGWSPSDPSVTATRRRPRPKPPAGDLFGSSTFSVGSSEGRGNGNSANSPCDGAEQAMPGMDRERQRRGPRQPGAQPRVVRITIHPSPERAVQTMVREPIPDEGRPFRARAVRSEGPGALPRAILRLPRWGAHPPHHGQGGPCLPGHHGFRGQPGATHRKRRGATFHAWIREPAHARIRPPLQP